MEVPQEDENWGQKGQVKKKKLTTNKDLIGSSECLKLPSHQDFCS